MTMARKLREESTERLREILSEMQKKLFDHRFRISAGEGLNPHEVRNMRRDIARIKTLLRAIELVSSRSGVSEAEARKALDGARWDIERAVLSAAAQSRAAAAGGTQA